jgi:hypothetical protein
MPYATTTLGQAVIDVSARLTDPANVRWSSAELQAYIIEAIRTWNALTGHFRDAGAFDTAAATPFYDLKTVCPGICGYTVTDAALVSVIEYHLLEPATPTAWTGSGQFTLSDVVTALQRRRDQFLLETGMVLTRTTPIVNPVMGGRVPLDESIITVRRAAFGNSDGVTSLHREDVWAFNHFARGWVQQPGRPPESPFGYSVGETPPLVLQIVPGLTDRGTLDLVSVSRGTSLNPSGPVLMGVPDDWTWVVKFGALADLLSKDGLAQDPSRAAYCEARWQQGIEIAKTASTIWAARVNDIPIDMGPLTESDDFDAGWQGRTGSPVTLLTTTGTLLALSPVPDAVYGITVDAVRNAPVPASLSDFLQVGPELLDTIYDYVVHLAELKEGAPAVKDSQPLLDRFMREAGVTVAIDFASTPNLKPLTDQTRQDEMHTARMEQTT